MRVPTARALFWLMAGGCLALLGVALFMEHGMGLEPCPLCLLQRWVVAGVGLLALAAAAHGPGTLGVRVYGGLTGLVAAGGAGLAGRHLWLQSLPAEQAPSCGPGVEYLLEVLPLTEALARIVLGDGACAEVVWTFLGVSIPGWALVGFIGLVGVSGWQVVWPRGGE